MSEKPNKPMEWPSFWCGAFVCFLALIGLSWQFGTGPSDVCRILAHQPDNKAIYWSKDHCMVSPDPIPLEVKP